MPTLRRNSPEAELEKLIAIYLKAETDIINEIGRLRSQGLVDYHAVAALERVQAILRQMENDAWEYVPKMIEREFYVNHPEARRFYESIKKHTAGYENAAALTVDEQDVVQRLVMALMGEITDAAMTAMTTIQDALIGRTEPDVYRRVGLEQVAAQTATGRGVNRAVPEFVRALQREGVTAFVDRAGRKWSLHTYCTMASRTTRRQAEVLSVLTRDPEHDLYRISSHGTACALCAPYEGRVYSKSGTDPDFPPLADAFGKIDLAGPDTLANTWLNIHPNCLVPGGLVLAEGVMAHSCREYDGPVITLVTSEGNQITVTPNHPILTPEGFVPAGMLQENQEIVETTGEYRFLFGEAPNDINIPTPVENIGHSVMQTCGGTTVRVKGSAVQFHGDGIPDSKIKIVFPKCLVESEFNALGSEPLGKPGLPTAHFRRRFLLADSALFQIFNRALHATNGVMRRFGLGIGVETVPIESEQTAHIRKRTSAFRSDLCKSKPLFMQCQELLKLFRSGLYVFRRYIEKFLAWLSGKETVVHHGAFDRIFGYTEMLRHLRVSDPLAAEGLQRLLRQDVLIVSNLLHVSTSEYHGKVYNLQTQYGFYTYNNIITHNCLHVITPWTKAGRTEEEIEEIKRFSSPKTNPYSRDPRTEKQIEAYRKKEQARARWLRDYRQWERYRVTLGNKVPKTFETFLKHKRAGDEKYRRWEGEYRRANDTGDTEE